ncbi:MAG: glutathione S-transferase N-terminal domain-containing protein [Anaerolineales bacterium]|nr:glutathione S-transferase N-terminal domain-containing protein [Anaerolineales bacterium]
MPPEIILYATRWCSDCRRARAFLDRHQVPYRWIDIDRDQAAEKIVIEINRGMRSVPTLVWPDGSTMVEPSESELAEKLRFTRV